MMASLRFVAVQAVTGVLGEDEGHAVQSPVTEVAPEAVWVVLSLQSPQDFFLDRKLTVMALGERLLQHDSQLLYTVPTSSTHHVVRGTDKLPSRRDVVVAVQHNLALLTPEAVEVIALILHQKSSVPDGLQALAAFIEGGLKVMLVRGEILRCEIFP